MIWPFSLYNELAYANARAAALEAELASAKADAELMREDIRALLDRLLVATGAAPIAAPLELERQSVPWHQRRGNASGVPIVARNAREYQRLAELALAMPTAQMPEPMGA